MALITYGAAVKHLKQEGVLDVSPEDSDLALKIEQASALVLHRLDRLGEWNAESRPDDDSEFAIVQAATFIVLGNLYRFRGDDADAPSPIDDRVERMLYPLTRPTLA
jgi:hypothetical protein